MAEEALRIDYFSDVLCIWAYAAEIRCNELRQKFGDRVALVCRFIPVFGDTAARIGEGWKSRGGFEGYARHVQEIAGRFEHIEVTPEVWAEVRPASSAGAHLFLKAVQLWEAARAAAGEPAPCARPVEAAAWRLRDAFFREGKNVAHRDVQRAVAGELGLPLAAIEAYLDNGEAFAALCADAEAERRFKIEGSPTFVLNQGRQKLYGNVGYLVLEANVEELLRVPDLSQASWC